MIFFLEIVLVGTGLIYLGFLLAVSVGFKRVTKNSKAVSNSDKSTSEPTVSLIIPARNEERSIAECLDHVLASTYPDEQLEVIVVDDHSSDATASIAKDYAARSSMIRVVSLTGDETGKSAALNAGVAASSGQLIMTTDSDCRLSPSSIASNVSVFENGATVVAGSVFYERSRSAFGSLQALEFLGLIAVGAGCIGLGRPTICNSSNLLYPRELAKRVAPDGFESVAAADELIIQSLDHNANEVAGFNADTSAFAMAEPVATVGAFLRQRLRWAAAVGSFENFGALVISALVFVFLLLLTASPVLLILVPSLGVALGIAWLIKFVGDLLVLIPATAWYSRRRLLTWFIPAEILHAPYIVVSVVLGLITSLAQSGRGGWK